MKFVSILSLVALVASTANAFAPSLPILTRAVRTTSQVYASDPKNEDEGDAGLDLNLEEMFDM